MAINNAGGVLYLLSGLANAAGFFQLLLKSVLYGSYPYTQYTHLHKSSNKGRKNQGKPNSLNTNYHL